MATNKLDLTYRPKIEPYVEGNHYKYAHYKRDGHFVRFEIATGPQYHNRLGWDCWTRRPTWIADDVYQCWKGLGELQHGIRGGDEGRWILLGEMFYPGKEASYVKTGLKNKDTALQIEFFAVVACPYGDIDDWSGLEAVESLCKGHSIPFAPYETNETSVADLWAGGKVPDVEGFVLKYANLIGWQKWKAKKTIDLIVTGFIEGYGKYAGSVGALIVNTSEGVEVASVGTGLSDEMRSWINANRKWCIGKVIEVEYQYVGAQGRLRHPVFVRWRDDKHANECGLSQDLKLLEVWGGK